MNDFKYDQRFCYIVKGTAINGPTFSFRANTVTEARKIEDAYYADGFSNIVRERVEVTSLNLP